MAPSLAPPDAIVVLGCRVEPDGALSPTLRRRADWAGVAYASGLGRWVVASGGRRWGEHVEAERVASHLAGRGVPSDALVPELLSLTTAENAIFCAQLLESVGARRALLVTCEWHMARALACFRSVGVDALPLPVLAAPSGLWTRAYRRGHEVVSSRLDAWSLRRVQGVRGRRGAHPFDAASEGSRST